MKGPIRGQWLYLYLMMDVWSRKIMGWRIEYSETSKQAAALMAQICTTERIDSTGIILHSDNGSPMKGKLMREMLEDLGVTASFSRPYVKNDNAYSESLFRTVKGRPTYPARFKSIEKTNRDTHFLNLNS